MWKKGEMSAETPMPGRDVAPPPEDRAGRGDCAGRVPAAR